MKTYQYAPGLHRQRREAVVVGEILTTISARLRFRFVRKNSQFSGYGSAKLVCTIHHPATNGPDRPSVINFLPLFRPSMFLLG